MDTLASWLNLALVVGGLIAWSVFMVGYAEAVDRWKRIDDAHQEKLSKLTYLWMRFVVWVSKWLPPMAIWGVGAFAIFWVGIVRPEVGSLAVMVAGGAYALRAPDDPNEPTEVQQLRAALGDVVKDPDNPPKVTLEGEHPDGGPTDAYIGGHPNFKEYTKAHRDALENAIEYRLPGDWEPVDWYGDGSSHWVRVIHPPDQLDHPGHHDDLPALTPPIGADGLGHLAIMNLIDIAHWFIAAVTRKGKTTILRGLNIHLLRHKVRVIGFDVKGGLAYLRGRPGVTVYTQRIEHLEAGMRLLREEVEARTDQFERDGSYREEIVAEVDELAVACDRAYALGPAGKDKGARYPRFVADLLEVIRLGGQVGVHVVIATQRPGADVIPIEIKEQCEGRITVGAVSQEVAQMMFESGWARAVNTPDKKGRFDMGHSSGEDCAWWQAWWTADPADEHHPLEDRMRAEALLPPLIPSSVEPTVAESGDNPQVETKSKREPFEASHGEFNGSREVIRDVNVATPTERGLLAMLEKAEREKIRHREEARRSLAKLRRELREDPNDRRHGTRRGRVDGLCECVKCVPKVEVSS